MDTQTCTALHKATYERSLWLRTLNVQAASLPLPLHILRSFRDDVLLNDYSTLAIESTARITQRIAEAWPRRRQGPLRVLPNRTSGNTLLGLGLFVDRWLLVIYREGPMYLYDLQPSSGNGNESNCVPELRPRRIQGGFYQWTSYCAVVDHRGEELVVALCLAEGLRYPCLRFLVLY